MRVHYRQLAFRSEACNSRGYNDAAMEILYASRMGFCYGVRNAYEQAMALAEQALSRASSAAKPATPVYLLGDIVHNAEVVARIEAAGIHQVKNPDEITEPHARVLIRTHGCRREDIELLTMRGHEVVDLTCEVVLSVRQKAMKLEQRHPAVVVLGKKRHPEVIGLVSWLRNPFVVSDDSDIAVIPDYPSVGAVSQTTFARELQQELVGLLRERFPLVEALDTICRHTERNQQTSVELARQCDKILVIGDQHSSNSRQLYEVVRRANARAHFLSRPEQVESSWFPESGAGQWENLKVGLTAGASTPDWIVSGIARRVRELAGDAGASAETDGAGQSESPQALASDRQGKNRVHGKDGI